MPWPSYNLHSIFDIAAKVFSFQWTKVPQLNGGFIIITIVGGWNSMKHRFSDGTLCTNKAIRFGIPGGLKSLIYSYEQTQYALALHTTYIPFLILIWTNPVCSGFTYNLYSIFNMATKVFSFQWTKDISTKWRPLQWSILLQMELSQGLVMHIKISLSIVQTKLILKLPCLLHKVINSWHP